MRARARLSPTSWLPPGLGTGLLLGSGAFFFAAGIVAACGAPTLASCRVEAVAALPDHVLIEPESLSVSDVRELAERLRACNAQQDGGAQ